MVRRAKTVTALAAVWAGWACAQNTAEDTIVPDAGRAAGNMPTGFYSVEQAERGRVMFNQICSECHGTSDFRGSDFEFEWRRQTVWDLYREMSDTMPEDTPGSLSASTYAAVIAYILQINDYAAGDIELVATVEAMDIIALGPGADKTGSSSPRHDD